MARSIDDSDQQLTDLDPTRPLSRREARRQAKEGIPQQSRGADDTPAAVDPADDSAAAASSTEQDEPARDGDVVPATVPRRRRGWLPWVAGLLVLALAAGGGLFWWTQNRPAPTPAPAAPAVADQTAFISLTTADGKSAGGLLLVGHQREAHGLLVPADLMLDTPGAGTTTIREAQSLGTDVPGQALSDALAVPVDGHWALPLDSIVTLTDAEGGITVTVDVPVEANGVILQPGEQRLTGVAAATYAGWSLTGEPSSGQLARSGQILTALIQGLPDDEAAIQELLGSTGGTTTFETGDLAAFLLRIKHAQDDGDFGGSLLPVTAAPNEANPNAVSLDVDAASAWLETTAPGLQVRTPAVSGHVQVKNASGIDKVQDPARADLLSAGFGYTYAGLAEPIQPTTVVMYSQSRGTQGEAEAVAEALGLSPEAVQLSDDIPLGQDVVILLGEDYAVAAGLAEPIPAAGEASADAPADGAAPADEAPTDASAAEPAPAN